MSKSESPLVSILVPVYNTSKYLKKCLDSLINQTLQDIEIICVDDGSTDDSSRILRTYAEMDKRIKVITKPNGGLPSARNAGIDAAKGKYLGFVDSDDYVSLNMFERLTTVAIRRKSDIVVCGAEIFPKKPVPQPWLEGCLSPQNKHFKRFTPNVLLETKGARPFLWRNLIKRSLIENNNLRLDESVILGEDQAFQFKVFPKADRITFIKDKLYHYRWFREDSIMSNEHVRTKIDYAKRVFSHIRMLTSISEEILKTKNTELMQGFLKWSCEFIYDDLIKIDRTSRINAAKQLYACWSSCAYAKYIYKFDKAIIDKFNYIESLLKEEPFESKVSFIVVANNNFSRECLDSILSQSLKECEVILIINGADSQVQYCANKYLNKDSRISVVNQSVQPLALTFNTGLQIARAKYVAFAHAKDRYLDKEALEGIYTALEEGKLPMGGFFQACKEGIYRMSDCQTADMYSFVYNRNFLIQNECFFEDYSFITGQVFLQNCLATAESVSEGIYLSNKELYCENKILPRNSIYFLEAELILEGIVKLLEISQKYNLTKLNEKVFNLINSENYTTLLTESTRGTKRKKADFSKYENCCEHVLELLLRANMLIMPNNSCGAKTVLKPLYRFMQLRKDFINYAETQ